MVPTKIKLELKYQKQVEDLANLLTKEDYQQFFNSKLVEEARALLNATKVPQKYPGGKQFTVTWDYIISTLILQNSSRPGSSRSGSSVKWINLGQVLNFQKIDLGQLLK